MFAPDTLIPIYNWSSVDWSKTNKEIAQESNRDLSVVRQWRKKLHPETVYDPASSWKYVDWSKGTAQIAREMNVNDSTVWNARKKYAPETLHKNKVYNIDWSKSNQQIAQENEIPFRQILQLRRRFAPETIQEGNELGIDWSVVDWNKRTGQLAYELGVVPSTVSQARSRYAPETLRPAPPNKFNWNNVDWKKSNDEIAKDLIEEMISVNEIYPEEITKEYRFHVAQLVSLRRSRYAAETKFYPVDWQNIDWTKSNREIAIENNLTFGHVWHMRKKYAPSSMPSYREEPVIAMCQSWYEKAQQDI
jgi:hypothetical protein